MKIKKIRMNKDELIESFINNNYISESTELIGCNLRAFYSGDKRILINYTTPIAIIDTSKDYNTLILNEQYYSRTTSVNTNKLKTYASFENMNVKRVSEELIYKLYWE